ncbi:MAG: 4-carboxy-4-hydroxy-2-oxoadipate aldolase/oxaloacetate decarboxylase [Acidiferrobacterales bacterium]
MTVNKDFERAAAHAVAALRRYGTATLHEALGQRGAMPFEIKPLYSGMRLCGPALTVAVAPGDNLMIHYALTLAQPGDVLVVDAKGFTEAGPWGDIMTTAAMAKGIAGLVIDGCVRDAESLNAMGFAVFARGTSMKGTTKKLPGDINTPITCASVPIDPGDVVVGDDDGVVVIPRTEAVPVLECAREREASEEQKRRELRAGKTTIELLGVKDLLKSMGVE